MSEKIRPPEIEVTKEERERGRNVEINIIFARHSEKAIGDVYQEGIAISQSLLSPRGKELAQEFGRVLKQKGIRPKGGFVTPIERTAETLREIFKTSEPLDQIERRYLSFPVEFPEEVEKRFQEIYLLEREKLMKEKYPDKDFKKLSSEEQEDITWQATEPALEWILSLDKTYPDSDKSSISYQRAAQVAYKLNHFINLAERLRNGKRIDLLSIGHKTQTEPFLVYTLKDLKGRTLIERLRELGGGLHVMEGWRLNIRTDEKGDKIVSLFFRDKKYEVNLEKLRELAEEGRKILGKEKRKIDEPL